MSFLPGWYPPTAKDKPAEILYISGGYSTTEASSYNFGSHNIPHAPSSKRCLLAFFRSSYLVSGSHYELKFDGAIPPLISGVASFGMQWYLAPWPTGTSVAITASASNQLLAPNWALWSVINLKHVDTYFDVWANVGVDTSPMSIDVAAGGVVAATTNRGASVTSWDAPMISEAIFGGDGQNQCPGEYSSLVKLTPFTVQARNGASATGSAGISLR